MKTRLVLLLLALPVGTLLGQQRPLITERAETLEKGHILFDLGFEFLQEAVVPLSGLRGDLTRVGVVGFRYGVAENVEIAILGSLQDSLNINSRFTAPNSDRLDFSGDSTNDFGDFTLASKVRLMAEKPGLPGLSLRLAVELPNTSNESGLGIDETNVYTTLLFQKSVGPLTVLGNAGAAILGDPVEGGAQDDLFTYGLAGLIAAHPKLNLLAEVYGRSGPGGIGTEDQSRVRAGFQIKAGGVSWDIAGFWGLEDTDPDSGLIIGFSKEFSFR